MRHGLEVVLANIPSLVDDIPYADFEIEEDTIDDECSDGVPEPIGDVPERMPAPPRVSRPLYDVDKTKKVRL